MNLKEEQKLYGKLKTKRSKNEFRCRTCGHTVYIHPTKEKHLCEFCNRYIYRDEKNNISYISLLERLKVRYIHFQRNLKGE